MFGLSTLKDFANRAIKQKSEIGILSTPEDSDFGTMIERLSRAKDIMGCWDYNILANNCQSAANYVSFGIKRTAQGEMVIKSAVIIFINLATLAASSRYWSSLSHYFYGKKLPEKV